MESKSSPMSLIHWFYTQQPAVMNKTRLYTKSHGQQGAIHLVSVIINNVSVSKRAAGWYDRIVQHIYAKQESQRIKPFNFQNQCRQISVYSEAQACMMSSITGLVL